MRYRVAISGMNLYYVQHNHSDTDENSWVDSPAFSSFLTEASAIEAIKHMRAGRPQEALRKERRVVWTEDDKGGVKHV